MSQERGPQQPSRRNGKARRQLQLKRTKRRPILETLEARQMMTIAPVEGTPFWNWPGNYTPPQAAQFSTVDFLSAPAAGDAVTLAKNYLLANGTQYGVNAADMSRAIVTNSYTDSATGIRHVYLQQTYNGLPVADAHANVSLAADGRVISASSTFVRNLSYPPTNTTPAPSISPQQALEVFAQAAYISGSATTNVTEPASGTVQETTLTDSDVSNNPIIARLQYVPSPAGGVDLSWQLIVQEPKTVTPHWFDVAIGAAGPRASQVTRVADWVNNATYTVLARPTQDPLYGPQAVVTNPHDSIASPHGWHDLNFLPGPDTTDTTGNNVIAQTPGPLPQTAQSVPVGSLNFNYTFDPTQGPAANQNAQLTNLFYWANLAHDAAYRNGFDEAAGNFQFANRAPLGVPSDPVIALDQATFLGAPVLNNAFMATPPDGQSPTLSMGVFTLVPPGSPFRSSSMDGTIILHEYAHGISMRLTGGPANTSALNNTQSQAMGEGWSDWFAHVLTIKPGDTAFTPRTSGQWVLGQALTGPGVRRFPYSFDMSVNPLTLGDFNGGVNLPPGPFDPHESHNAGEIWMSALWDMTWMLINKYGLSNDVYGGNGGNNIAMRLVMQGMKLQPTNPDFLDARDAIISADLALNAGANYELIWQAFARRGFGWGAATPGSNSLIVFEAFDVPPPLGHVRGTVFNDLDADGRRDGNEPPLSGITVYHDANRNARLDAGERTVVTAIDGSYDIAFVTTQQVQIRQALTAAYKQTLPANNAARTVFVVAGQTIWGQDFGNIAAPGQISGFKFNDMNANSVFDAGDFPISRTYIYVDLNNDGKLGILEPAAVTDNYGRYVIKGVPPGSNYIVREVLAPGVQQMVPGPIGLSHDPAGPGSIPFAWTNVQVFPNQTTPHVNFANTTSEDFGDAPDSYGTTRAANGARHGILPGFHLGARVDAEPDGQPTSNATGDDLNPVPPDPLPVPPPPSGDDEDGIVFVGGGISPGSVGTVTVTVTTTGNFPGRLHAWIDFDQDGRFESEERVIANLLLEQGTRNVSFLVPATARQGQTFARFRYGYESDLAPIGPSAAGEVEDYFINVLPAVPVANPDAFNVKEDAVDFPLDVLANDSTTVFGPPSIVPGSFPSVLPGTGSTLRLNAAGNRILYTAGPGVRAGMRETFTYRVTDGRTESAPATVTLNVTVSDPIVLDDTFTLPANDLAPVAATLEVMANDLVPDPNSTIISVSPIGDARGTTLEIDGTNPQRLIFSAPPGFRGSVFYSYTIDDPSDPTTAPDTGVVTIQVVDPGASDAQLAAAGYQADLSVVLLDPLTGLPTGALAINQGDIFSVRVTGRDLRPDGTDENRGVMAAYLDLLFDRTKIEPVPAANEFGFAITFDPRFDQVRNGEPNEPAEGQIDEVGASMGFNAAPPGLGDITVFTVQMRAIAPTSGTPTQIVADPADASFTTVTVSGDPNDPDPNNQAPFELTDAQVFLRESGSIVIFGAGEGLFVNRENPLDVTQDGAIAPDDVLAVVNNLNSGGSRSLFVASTSLTAGSSVYGMVDVNMDSMLSPIDALTVINYLNSRPRTHFIDGSGEGEGEAAAVAYSPTSTSNSATDASVLALMSLDESDDDSTNVVPTTSTVVPVSDSTAPTSSESIASGGASSTTTSSTTSTTNVDAAAADDLFAEMETARSILRQRYRR